MAERKSFPKKRELVRAGPSSRGRPVLLLDPKGRISFASPACEGLLGYRKEELLGKRLSAIYPSGARARWQRALARARATGQAEAVLPLLKRDGTELPRRVALSALGREHDDGLEIALADRAFPELGSSEGQEMALLNEIVLSLDRAPDLATGLREALGRILAFSGFPVGGIVSVDRERGIIVPQVHVGMPPALLEDLEREPQRVDEGFAGLAMRLQRPLVSEDLTREPRITRAALKESGLRTVVVVPLLAQDQAVGFLVLLAPSRMRVSNDQLQALQTIANHLGIAVARFSSFLREERRLSELLLVERVARKASSILDLEQLLTEVAQEIQRTFNYHDVLIFSVDKERGELVRRAWAGSYERPGPREARLPITDHGLLSWVVRHGRTALVNDVPIDPRYEAFFPQTRAELCVPLIRGGEVIGGINVESVRPHAFDETDLALLEALADQLVISITNAELYRDLERRVAERTEELQRERDRLSLVARTMGAGLALISRDYRTVWANGLLKEMFGEVEGKPCYETYNQQPSVCPWCPARQVFEGAARAEAEAVGSDRQGKLVWSKIVATPIRDGEGKVTAVLEVVMPITERKEMEEALRTSQERLRALSRVALKIQGVLDEEGLLKLAAAELSRAGFRFTFWAVEGPSLVRRYSSIPREEIRTLYGLLGSEPEGFRVPISQSPLVAQALQERALLASSDLKRSLLLARLYRSHPEIVETMEEKVRGVLYAPLPVGGEARWLMSAWLGEMGEEELGTLEIFARHLSVALENAHHFRELREAQEGLLRQERLAAIGQLAGAIAHSLRNPLGVVGNAVFYLKSKLEGRGERVHEHLELIEREIADLLGFAFRGQPERRRFALQKLVDQVLAEAELPEGVSLTRALPSRPIWVEADPRQLQQVFRNIILNAVEAMDGRGALLVRAWRRGKEVAVKLEDTGPGLPAAEAARVFEPLFSTKTRGAGLGLTICKQIIEDHGGKIRFESEEGRGSRVTIWLPRCEEEGDG
ncbi:MAG: GAF domain-containing protein [Candidatus Acetothermia bacterium]|nr:GAF domain-containing protein [Candidatus Acetothermia bacterium]MDH7504854.1 GAF domain-containing protein [Candidatus Acetothermia bacterium]